MTYRFGRLPAILKHEWEWYQSDRFERGKTISLSCRSSRWMPGSAAV